LSKPVVPSLPSESSAHNRGRTVGIVSILTVVVACFGYFREAALAAHFGLSTTMDAYFAAIFVPTIFYMILIAGTLSPIFIPILLSTENGGSPQKLTETFSVVTTFVLLFLIVIVSGAMLTAPSWLAVLFPGFSASTAAMSTRLIYIIFPSVLFVALAGILTALLNGFHKFALASFAPALSSLAVIVAVLLAHGENAIYLVGMATAAGFLLQFLFLIPAAAKLGFRYTPSLNFSHSAIRKLLRLGGPLLLYLVIATGSAFVERNLASQLSVGAVSTLTYAMRLFTIPSNFLAAPLGIVVYPQFAREALREGRGNLAAQVSRIFRAILFIFVPITLWTIINALPITRLLFERGQFKLENSIVTAQVLRLYGIGILPLAMGGILLRCFYAVEDTVTALYAEIVDLIFYVIVATFFTRRFGIQGLALTRGISFYLVTGILVVVLWNRKHLLHFDLDMVRFIALTTVASLAMVAINWISWHFFYLAFDRGGIAARISVVASLGLITGGTFIGVARLFRVKEATHVMTTLVQMVTGVSGSIPHRNGVV